jgi:hypothetical protein
MGKNYASLGKPLVTARHQVPAGRCRAGEFKKPVYDSKFTKYLMEMSFVNSQNGTQYPAKVPYYQHPG